MDAMIKRTVEMCVKLLTTKELELPLPLPLEVLVLFDVCVELVVELVEVVESVEVGESSLSLVSESGSYSDSESESEGGLSSDSFSESILESDSDSESVSSVLDLELKTNFIPKFNPFLSNPLLYLSKVISTALLTFLKATFQFADTFSSK